MIGIPKATAIILTTAERTELEGLVRSTKMEHRLRQRARIVLLATEGMTSRPIERGVGCTIKPQTQVVNLRPGDRPAGMTALLTSCLQFLRLGGLPLRIRRRDRSR